MLDSRRGEIHVWGNRTLALTSSAACGLLGLKDEKQNIPLRSSKNPSVARLWGAFSDQYPGVQSKGRPEHATEVMLGSRSLEVVLLFLLVDL